MKQIYSKFKGFFFYNHIIRKDLFNKLMLIENQEIPSINSLFCRISTNQKQQIVSDNIVFSWICIIEFLMNSFVLVKKGTTFKLNHFTELENLNLTTNIFDRHCVYEFFIQVFFLFYKGLLYPSEQFLIQMNSLKKKKLNIKKKGKKVNQDEIVVIYFKYIEPKIKVVDRKSFIFTSFWPDFTFLVHVPIGITYSVLESEFKLQFSFSSSEFQKKKLLLSGLRLWHRISKIR